MQSLPATKERNAAWGKKQGAIAVATGQLQSIKHLGGRRSAEIGHCAAMAPYAAHVRWHVLRNRISPLCNHCAETNQGEK